MLAGDQLSDIVPQAVDTPPPSIEHTVGDYAFHLDGGKVITSVKAGRSVNRMILDQWRRSGFIRSENYVKSSQFTDNAEYNLTLGGRQEGDSSVVLQVLSGLTLLIIPYSVNTQLDLVYTLEHVESGRSFEAKASDSYRSITQLLLFPISPFAMGGMLRTYKRLADHLYEQLAEQGAFDPDRWPDASTEAPVAPNAMHEGRGNSNEGSAVERLRVLDQLRNDGVITTEEYESKKKEILRDL